jgi:hypothetical protein
MKIRVGRSRLEEAQRLNYSVLLYLVHNATEIKATGPIPQVLDLNIDEAELKDRLSDLTLNVFANVEKSRPKEEIALPLLLYSDTDGSICYPTYNFKRDSINFEKYEAPRVACVACGILHGNKKEYQEVSLRADYKQKPLDPFSRDQIQAVCPFCFFLAKASKSTDGVWDIRKERMERYRYLMNKKFFGSLAFTLKKDLQYVVLPLFQTVTLFEEAEEFARFSNNIVLGEDIYNYINFWSPKKYGERDFPHLLMAIMDKSGVFEVDGFLLFERRRRGRKWSTERILHIKKLILRTVRPYILHKRKVKLDDDTSRSLAKAIRALVDGDFMSYYAVVGGDLPHRKGSFISRLIDPDKWNIKGCVEEIRKALILMHGN